ncbi:MAG: UpxY family transcription antiterminator [Bacteroidales bacterium]|nr:UpxY family transcription antiterminator [Bacteroidales bacterium]
MNITKSTEPRNGSSVNGTDDREACTKSWIALYTRPRSEKKVRDYLNSIGIENYLPVQYQLRQWSDRKKLVEVVVIPMVIFVTIERPETFNIPSNPLILRPVYQMGRDKKPALIPDSQIAQLKFILGQSDYPVTFDSTIFKVNDKVRVVRGPLMGLTGEIVNCDDKYLELAVPIGIRGAARLNIEKINVEVL